MPETAGSMDGIVISRRSGLAESGAGRQPLIAARPNYVIESYSGNAKFADLEDSFALIDVQRYTPYYEMYMYPRPHRTYLGFVGEERSNPIFISLEEPSAFSPTQQVLVRTTRPYTDELDGDEWVTMPPQQKSFKKALRALLPELLPPNCHLNQVAGPEASPPNLAVREEMLKLERMLLVKNYKFGVVFRAADQSTENDMLNNQLGSPEFDVFLSLLGDKVTLMGFGGFRGGLDVNNNTTGEYSYYKKLSEDSIEVMYHVAPLLPYHPKDEQQLEKKRHIGNDVVVFIFTQSSATPFDPTEFVSEFNHVFIVVTPEHTDRLLFRISVVSKDGVHSKDPPLPNPPLLDPLHPKTADFLIKKAINSERSAMYAPSFSTKLERARKMVIENMAQQYATTPSSQSSSLRKKVFKRK